MLQCSDNDSAGTETNSANCCYQVRKINLSPMADVACVEHRLKRSGFMDNLCAKALTGLDFGNAAGRRFDQERLS